MQSNNRVKLRLAAVPEMQGKYTLLDSDQVETIYNRLHLVYLTERNQLKPSFQPVAQQIDLVDADNLQVRRELITLGIADNEQSQLVWVADRVGVAMKFQDFVQHYDNLWYPARDDLWVTNREMSWFLELNHEEILTFVASRSE